jgi:hypothetical protein
MAVGAAASLCLMAPMLAAQSTEPPRVRASPLTGSLTIDGRLDETAWASAERVDNFRQTDSLESAAPTAQTSVRVLAGAKAIVVGIVCDDPEPIQIVSFSVRRDAPLMSEDHVRVVFGPFLDGRSGYVFAVNPSDGRYNGLINPGGESDNPDWDGVWRAATARTATGWSVELWIPVLTLGFKPELHEWHFNVRRRIQRRLETDRWASQTRP